MSAISRDWWPAVATAIGDVSWRSCKKHDGRVRLLLMARSSPYYAQRVALEGSVQDRIAGNAAGRQRMPAYVGGIPKGRKRLEIMLQQARADVGGRNLWASSLVAK